MMPQDTIFTLLLVFLALLDSASGFVARVDDRPVLHGGPCSYAVNRAGIASVNCFFPTGVPTSGDHDGHSSGSSYNPLAAQLNASWAPVTETYTTTDLDVITPINRTGTYTDLSTKLTIATVDFNTATQTIVEIVGYSTIHTYTTTFLAPASSTTYSTVQTVTTTSSELLVPSVDTLTLTGGLPPSIHSFPTLSAKKRGLIWRSLENGTGVLLTLTPDHEPPYINAAAITLAPFSSHSAHPSFEAESVREHSRSSSTNVFKFTVTETYSITPTSEHKHKTTSRSKDASATSWLSASPTIWISTHHLSNSTTMYHNTSTAMHATITTLISDTSSSTVVHTSSTDEGFAAPAKVTDTASPTSTSGSSVVFHGLVVQVGVAVLAIALSAIV